MTQNHSSNEEITIRCRLVQVCHHNSDTLFCVCSYRVLTAGTTDSRLNGDSTNDRVFTAIGTNLPTSPLPVALTGRWTYSEKRQTEQFVVTTSTVLLPETETEVVAMLQSLGLRMGPSLVHKMISYAGSVEDFWNILITGPQSFLEVTGMTSELVNSLVAKTIGIVAPHILRQFFGDEVPLSNATYTALCKLYEGKPVPEMLDSIKQNPYILLDLRSGYSFLQLDDFCIKHGVFTVSSGKRLLAAAFDVLRSQQRDGSHSCIPQNVMLSEMEARLSPHGCPSWNIIRDFLNSASVRGQIAFAFDSYYTAKSYKEESMIAGALACMSNQAPLQISRDDFDQSISDYGNGKGFQLSADQKEAVWVAATSPVAVITGGPGTGKSTILDALLYVWRKFQNDSILMLAPTGKAAMRMRETTGCDAQTIHSALSLGVDISNDHQFVGASVDLPQSLILVDECSMVDQPTMAALVSALRVSDKVAQHLVLVGDINQLPSVGYGNVLADIIASEVVPVRRLNTIYRQGAGNPIITNANRMQAGITDMDWSSPLFRRYANPNDPRDEANLEGCCRLYCAYARQVGAENVALLSPYHNATKISTTCINRKLQEMMNPSRGANTEIRYGSLIFRLGDRVMQTKNTAYASNGDVGVVEWINTKAAPRDYCLTVRFEGSGVVQYRKDELCHLDLAYAMSIHKSQGSQWKVVIIVLPERPTAFLRRNLIYTGITRSSRVVAIVGSDTTVRLSIANAKLDRRYTNLVQQLRKCV